MDARRRRGKAARLLLLLFLYSCGLVLTALGLATAGCRFVPEAPITSPVTVTFWHSQRWPAAELLAEMAAEFSAANPNITVVPVYRGEPAQLVAELRDGSAPGGAPVLAEVPETALASLRVAGLLRPLQGFIMGRQYGLSLTDLEDFWPCFVESNTAGKQVWGLPLSHRVYALIYDPALVGSPPTTWAELTEAAAALTRRVADPAQSTFGLAFRADANLFYLFLHQNGGRIAAGDPPRCVMNSPEGVAALDYLFELACLRRCVLLTVSQPLPAVSEGRAAMAIGAPRWPVNGQDGGRPLAIAPLPEGVARATLSPGSSLVILRGPDPVLEEAAWRFIQWLTNPGNAARWAAGTGDVPIRRSVLGNPVWLYGPGLDPGWRAVVAQMEYAVVTPGVSGWEEVHQNLSSTVSTYLLGRTNSAQSVLDRLSEAANRALSAP